MNSNDVKINRVEQHIINKNHFFYKIINDISYKSKNLYNYTNYHIKQTFINENKWLKAFDLMKLLRQSEPFRELGSDISEYVIKTLDQNWKSFFASIKDWKNNPHRYKGKPNLPKYLDKEKGRNQVILRGRGVKINDEGYILFSQTQFKPLNGTIKTNIKSDAKIAQVRFIPSTNKYIMEIVYEIVPESLKQDNNRIAAIDIGIDNLATVTTNCDIKPIAINGKPLKSINQYYNKEKAKIQSELKTKHDKNWSNRLQRLTDKRNNKIKTYIHQSSRYIVDWCIENEINTLIVGKNDGWKQESNMSKRNNQNFVSIPHTMLINQLKYKCENVGINFIETEESYTSGTSFLDNEEPTKEYYNKKRRLHRGLFISNKGVEINADVNGSYQIMNKKIKYKLSEINNELLHPTIINL